MNTQRESEKPELKRLTMTANWMIPAAAGAAATWFLDPDSGRRRRSIMRDKTRRTWKLFSSAVQVGAWDLRHVTEGRLAELRAAFQRDTASDRVVRARMRALLGRHVSHPGAVTITVDDGMATLMGPIIRHEVDPLLDALLSVRGVRGIESRLEIYDSAGPIPSLQGGVDRDPPTGWRPASRMLAGIGGCAALATAGFMPRGRRWPFVLGAGLLFVRASTRLTTLEMFGVGVGRRLVELERSIVINAPAEKVEAFLEAFENFPLFMEQVKSVEALGGDRVRWHLIGPARVPMVVETERVDEGQEGRVAWRSVAGKPRHRMDWRLYPTETGTRVALRFAYTPPAGLAGHGVGLVTRTDPKHALDRDLIRLKSLLEIGKTTLRGQTVVFTPTQEERL